MINVDRALRLRLKAVQGIGIDGDRVKRRQMWWRGDLDFLKMRGQSLLRCQTERPVQVHLRHDTDSDN